MGVVKVTEIARQIGVTPMTIKNWEGRGCIPQAQRMGIDRRRVWDSDQVQTILQFAESNGYSIKKS